MYPGERLDEDLHADLLQHCITLCTTYSLSVEELVSKWDTYKFTQKYHGKGTSLTLERLQSFEQYLQARSKSSTTNNQRKSNVNVLKPVNKSTTSRLNNNIKRTTPVDVDDVLGDLLGEDIVVKAEPREEEKENVMNVEEVQQERNDDDFESAVNIHASNAGPSDFISPAPQRTRSVLQSSPQTESKILSILQSSSQVDDKYSLREVSNAPVVTYNENIAMAEPTSLNSQRLIDIHQHSTYDEQEHFRYMYVDEEEMREVMQQRHNRLQQALCQTREFQQLVGHVKMESQQNVGSSPTTMQVDTNTAATTSNSQPSSSQDSTDDSTIKVKPEPTESTTTATTTIKPESIDDLTSTFINDPEQYLVATNTRSTESITVCGRIVVDDTDSNSRLTTSNILLEGDRYISNGKRINLRLGLLQHYTLFPGQYCIVQGLNETGHTLIAENILSSALLPHRLLQQQQLQQYNTINNYNTGDEFLSPLSIMIAAGPFTVVDTLNYQPLYDLLQRVYLQRPHVLVLIGPFIDCEHPAIHGNDSSAGGVELFTTATYSELFDDLMNEIIARLTDIQTRIVIVPSTRDIHHTPVYPQPPFKINSSASYYSAVNTGKLQMLSNPTTVSINDVTFGISSSDCLQQMAAQYELAKVDMNAAVKQNRVQRLAAHFIQQQSYYPVCPSTTQSVDYSHESRITMPYTPDLLIMPSKIKYFASDIGNNCIAINPESITKGNSAGFYAHVTVHSLKDHEITSATQHHHITARTRVDICKL